MLEERFCLRPYTRTFIYLILHSSYEVRKQAHDIIRRLVNNLRSSEIDISLAILNGLSSYLDHYQLTVNMKDRKRILTIIFI
jgi:hypothetical protein